VKDPYSVLGVDRSATAAEIKSAFKRLAAKHHPDRNDGDAASVQRFKEINAAYQILSDPKKRAMFDRFGAAGVGGAAARSGPFGGAPIDLGDLNVDGLFGDLLDALGIRIGDRGDIQTEMAVSFEEAAFGCKKTVSYERIGHCEGCRGTGAASGAGLATCGTCGGRGRVRMQQGVFPIAVDRACPTCQGRGRIPERPCGDCAGSGLRKQRQEVEVVLPPGVENGATQRVEGMGHMTRQRRPGALEVVIRVRPHELFRRAGHDVICTLPITFAQAVLGDEVEIPTLDGKGMLRVPAGTQPGTVLRIRGKGIPHRVMAGRGDQLVEVQVEIPTDLTDSQKELVVQLAEELGESVQPQRRTFVDKLKDLFS
jgi:molecular chaperone DnaJ